MGEFADPPQCSALNLSHTLLFQRSRLVDDDVRNVAIESWPDHAPRMHFTADDRQADGLVHNRPMNVQPHYGSVLPANAFEYIVHLVQRASHVRGKRIDLSDHPTNRTFKKLGPVCGSDAVIRDQDESACELLDCVERALPGGVSVGVVGTQEDEGDAEED